jgi:hypothetical protein
MTQFDYCIVLGVKTLKWISLSQNQGVCRTAFLLEALAEVLLSLIKLLFSLYLFRCSVWDLKPSKKKKKRQIGEKTGLIIPAYKGGGVYTEKCSPRQMMIEVYPPF